MNSIERFVEEIKMTPALEKCTNLTITGKDENYHICDGKLKQQTEVNDCVVMVFGSVLFQPPQCFLCPLLQIICCYLARY